MASEIVVLANSKKLGGRCIAGIDLESGRWIRPVSGFGDGQLLPFHYRIDSRDTTLLDVVCFDHGDPCDDPSQPENVALGDAPWRLMRRLDVKDAYGILAPYLVEGPELLGDRKSSLPERLVRDGVESSLALIEPTAIEFVLQRPWQGRGGPRARVDFELDGCGYDLPLTDYFVRPRLNETGYGRHDAAAIGVGGEHILLAVSLGGAYRGSCWKLAAGVLFLP